MDTNIALPDSYSQHSSNQSDVQDHIDLDPQKDLGMGLATGSAETPPRSRWWHLPEESIPEQFKHGPLVGTQITLAKIICPVFGHAVDRRALRGLALDGDLWIVKSPGRQRCRVYFGNHHLYAEANGNRLRLENKQKQS